MKKTFKLMLVALLAMVSTSVSAQELTAGKYFPYGNFIYKVITAYDPATETPGTVSIEAIRKGKGDAVVNAEGKLSLVGSIDATLLEETFKANVLYVTAGALQKYGSATLGAAALTDNGVFDKIVDVKSVVIPKEFTTVQTGTFVSFTNISSITFEAGSALMTVQTHAFTTTQTKVFDFSPCTALYELPDEAFVEAGLTNTYITTVTLPDHSADSPVVPFVINKSLASLPALTTINNLDKCNVQLIPADAFNGDVALTTLEVPASVTTIKDEAFQLSGIKDLTINVGNLATFGDGTKSLYGAVGTGNPEVLESLTLKGVLNTAIATKAFEGCENLSNLDLMEMTFKPYVSGTDPGAGQFAANSFKDCTSLTSVILPTLQGSANPVIAADAFSGCTSLATVRIASISSKNVAVGAAAFGNSLKTVTIGTVDAGAGTIAAGAFVYGDVVGATLSLATGSGEYLKSSAASLIGAAAFNFSGVNATADRTDADYPTVTIGEIKSGNIFADGALKGNLIQSITFTGAIAASGIKPTAAPIITDNTAADITKVELKTLTFQGNIAADAIDAHAFEGLAHLETITFDGTIAAGGIKKDAFAGLTSVVTITFNGDLSVGAIATGAFQGLKAESEVYYTKDGATSTGNPFAKGAFDNAADVNTARDITLYVTDATLAAKYADGTTGLNTDQAFDIYRVIAQSAPVISGTLTVYRNANETTLSWGRQALTATAGKFVTIQRVQDIEGEGETKLTLYQTYTDEDPYGKQSTVYMLPLKAIDGVYYVGVNTLKTLIARAEKTDGTAFTNASVEFDEVEIAAAKAPAVVPATLGSIWADATDANLNKADNLMTNQQLVDKTATSGGVNFGEMLYTAYGEAVAGDEIARDIYVLTDPAKGKGIRVDKIAVTSTNNAYINTGWYFWMLAKFNDEAAARVIWLDNEPQVTAILGIKDDTKTVENGAIYNLQGMRIAAPQKGQVYIQNGKKFIAK